VFVAPSEAGQPILWARALEEVTARPLAGTEDAELPFWSPDSLWIGFVADARLKKIRASGGPPQEVTGGIADFRGGSWGPDDTILFGTASSGIYRVPASGGSFTAMTKLDNARHDGSHRSGYAAQSHCSDQGLTRTIQQRF
jgi:hypothetical protein